MYSYCNFHIWIVPLLFVCAWKVDIVAFIQFRCGHVFAFFGAQSNSLSHCAVQDQGLVRRSWILSRYLPSNAELCRSRPWLVFCIYEYHNMSAPMRYIVYRVHGTKFRGCMIISILYMAYDLFVQLNRVLSTALMRSSSWSKNKIDLERNSRIVKYWLFDIRNTTKFYFYHGTVVRNWYRMLPILVPVVECYTLDE